MMTTLSSKNVKLINTYLAMVPDAYQVGERRLVFDRVASMSNTQLEKFLKEKIASTTPKRISAFNTYT